jgi:hypothetical protein
MTRILFVLDRSFKAMFGLAANAGQGEQFAGQRVRRNSGWLGRWMAVNMADGLSSPEELPERTSKSNAKTNEGQNFHGCKRERYRGADQRLA